MIDFKIQRNTFQKKLIYLKCISFFIIGFDQLTKHYVHTLFQLHETKIIIKDFLSLTYVRNYGAAFGFLSQAPEIIRNILFLSMPPLACLLIIFLLVNIDVNLAQNTNPTSYSNQKQNLQIISLSCIFGGALGNYIDRLQYSYVIDFLDFHYQSKFSWPAFNIADMAIVSGVFIFITLLILDKNAPTH